MNSASPTERVARGFPHTTGRAEVVAVSRPAPRMVRVTLRAPEVADFPDEEPGEIITLIWPADGAGDVVLPLESWRYPEGTPEQHARNFTVRAIDPDASTVDVDIVSDGHGGHAGTWADAARPGDVIGIAGPRIHYVAEHDAPWTLLAGDETALPSILATLERLPDGHRAFAFVEVVDAGERQPVTTSADADVRWLHRGDTPAHASTLLLDALRTCSLPPGDGKVWLAGEAGVVRGLREHVRKERGLRIGQLQAIGYWKHTATREDIEEDIAGEEMP